MLEKKQNNWQTIWQTWFRLRFISFSVEWIHARELTLLTQHFLQRVDLQTVKAAPGGGTAKEEEGLSARTVAGGALQDDWQHLQPKHLHAAAELNSGKWQMIVPRSVQSASDLKTELVLGSHRWNRQGKEKDKYHKNWNEVALSDRRQLSSFQQPTEILKSFLSGCFCASL